jgi:hypothetical protein
MNMEMRLKEHGRVLDIQNQYKGKAKEETHVLIQSGSAVQWQMYGSDGR